MQLTVDILKLSEPLFYRVLLVDTPLFLPSFCIAIFDAAAAKWQLLCVTVSFTATSYIKPPFNDCFLSAAVRHSATQKRQSKASAQRSESKVHVNQRLAMASAMNFSYLSFLYGAGLSVTFLATRIEKVTALLWFFDEFSQSSLHAKRPKPHSAPSSSHRTISAMALYRYRIARNTISSLAGDT